MIVSAPAPPVIISLPFPPVIVSAPAAAVIVSLPLPPEIVSSLSPVIAVTPVFVRVRSYCNAASKLALLKVPVVEEKVTAMSPASSQSPFAVWFSSTRPTVAAKEPTVPSSTPPAVPIAVSVPCANPVTPVAAILTISVPRAKPTTVSSPVSFPLPLTGFRPESSLAPTTAFIKTLSTADEASVKMMVSSPAPPAMVSEPSPPVKLSFPAWPVIISLALEPETTAFEVLFKSLCLLDAKFVVMLTFESRKVKFTRFVVD